jgi:hypothetical protein
VVDAAPRSHVRFSRSGRPTPPGMVRTQSFPRSADIASPTALPGVRADRPSTARPLSGRRRGATERGSAAELWRGSCPIRRCHPVPALHARVQYPRANRASNAPTALHPRVRGAPGTSWGERAAPWCGSGTRGRGTLRRGRPRAGFWLRRAAAVACYVLRSSAKAEPRRKDERRVGEKRTPRGALERRHT